MYYSDYSNQFQYRWTQSRPEINSHRPDIHCNGKPCKARNHRESRDSNANMAFKCARCAEYLLSSLPDNYLIFKGCIAMPDKEIEDWRQFKITFNRYRRRWEKQTGFMMAFNAKQHITFKRGKVEGFKDDMHFDYLAFTDAPLLINEIRELILSWVHKSGGNRERSSCKRVEDRSNDNLRTLSDYNFKSPNTKELAGEHMKNAPLPATRFPVTWIMGNFWQCKTKVIESTVYWNDELITSERKISPMNQIWLQWIKSVCGDGIPRFTTEDHRIKIMADKLSEAEFSWDDFLNNDQNCESDTGNHPITYTVTNSDISSSKNELQIEENNVNNGLNLDPNKDSQKNTLQNLNDQPAISFNGYALQSTGDGRYYLRVGKSGKFHDPEAILGDGFHLVSGKFRLDQVQRIVTGLGHEFFPEDQWKGNSVIKLPFNRLLREKQAKQNR